MSWHSCGNVTSSCRACSICNVNECHECIRAEAGATVVHEIVARLRNLRGERGVLESDCDGYMRSADLIEREFLPRRDGEPPPAGPEGDAMSKLRIPCARRRPKKKKPHPACRVGSKCSLSRE
jgi:hypothetical protein